MRCFICDKWDDMDNPTHKHQEIYGVFPRRSAYKWICLDCIPGNDHRWDEHFERQRLKDLDYKWGKAFKRLIEHRKRRRQPFICPDIDADARAGHIYHDEGLQYDDHGGHGMAGIGFDSEGGL